MIILDGFIYSYVGMVIILPHIRYLMPLLKNLRLNVRNVLLLLRLCTGNLLRRRFRGRLGMLCFILLLLCQANPYQSYNP